MGFLSTPTSPISAVPCQMAKHGRLDKALALHGCYLRRFDQQGAGEIGLGSWPESGFFCLLFLAVEEKYGRAAGRRLKNRMRPPWMVEGRITQEQLSRLRVSDSACLVHEVHKVAAGHALK